MNRYAVTLNGETPLLMHNDNLHWAEVMEAWKRDPGNQKGSVPGDDRSPAWRWIGSLYVEGGRIVLPSDNLMTVLREGGKRCPTGKRGATFKSQTQSGIVVDQSSWPMQVNGKEVPFDEIKKLIGNADYYAHEALAMKLGFELFAKRARVGTAKHVRVRPRFHSWSATGTLTVVDDQITQATLENILTFAGTYAGVGDWRPSSPKSPGPFGKFVASVSKA